LSTLRIIVTYFSKQTKSNVMKRVLFASVLMFAATLMVTAQGTHQFQLAAGTYSDLSGSTSLNQGMVWDDPEYSLQLGFTFPFLGASITTVTVEDGYLDMSQDWDTLIVPYGADMIDRGYYTGTSLSTISYKSELVGGMQVMKIEWKNFGFYDEYDTYNTLNWYGNMQLWLYENGIFEVHIGPNSIAEPLVAFYGDPGPFVGFGTWTSFNWLAGLAANPTMAFGSIMVATTLGSVPTDGSIYRFIPIGISVPALDAATQFSLFPNPVVDMLSMNIPVQGSVEVYDLTGKKVMAALPLAEGKHTVNMSALSPGIYMVTYTTQSGERTTRRIVKK
jgi:hypothetical protein